MVPLFHVSLNLEFETLMLLDFIHLYRHLYIFQNHNILAVLSTLHHRKQQSLMAYVIECGFALGTFP